MVESTRVYEINPDSKTISSYLGITDERMAQIIELMNDQVHEFEKIRKKGEKANFAALFAHGSEKLNHPNELSFYIYMLTMEMRDRKERRGLGGRKIEMKEIHLDGSEKGKKDLDDIIKFLKGMKDKEESDEE